jgi:hypothetical protein
MNLEWVLYKLMNREIETEAKNQPSINKQEFPNLNIKHFNAYA